MDINLLPNTTRPKFKRSSMRGISAPPGRASSLGRKSLPGVVIPMAVVLVAGIALQVWIHHRATSLQHQVDNLQAQVQSTQTRGTSDTQAQTEDKVAQAIQQTTANRVAWDAILKDLNSTLPEGTTVDAVDSTSGPLQVTGRASGLAAVAAFESGLNGRSWVAAVSIQSVQVAAGRKQAIFTHTVGKSNAMSYTYNLTITLKTGLQQTGAQTTSDAGKASSRSSSATESRAASLPKLPDQAGFLATLANLQNATHVQIVTVQTVDDKGQQNPQVTASAPASILPSLHLKLHVQGTSQQLEAFLQALQRTQRLTRVSDVVIQSDSGGRMQADLDVLAYYSPAW